MIQHLYRFQSLFGLPCVAVAIDGERGMHVGHEHSMTTLMARHPDGPLVGWTDQHLLWHETTRPIHAYNLRGALLQDTAVIVEVAPWP